MRRKARISIKLGFLAVLLFAVAAIAQDDSQFRIRAKIDLVVVPVTVKAPGDRLLGSLRQKDFIIYEDGRRQTISNFTNDPVPLSAAVIVDTGLSADSLTKVQQSFGAMSGAFANQDEVAVYHYDKYVTKDLDFTDNQDTVETAMKKLRELKPDENAGTAPSWRGPFSNPGPIINGAPVLPPSLAGPAVNSPVKVDKVLHDAVFTAAADLGKRARSRRKMILLVSDGIAAGDSHSYEDAKNILLERGIQVYAVALDQPFPYSKLSVLEDYAKVTGGDTYFVKSTQHLERSYMDATSEARNQYVIGYISNNGVHGPGPVFREIKVQVAEAKVKTLYRKGYYAFP
ncbi:MAG TPA: VWA domain-containing protein [Terriglobia bacterium]|jgi:VWFA-related protein